MKKKLKRSIYPATSLLITILNIVEIIYIAKIKRRKRIYEIILASLSVSDCLFSLLSAIFSSIGLYKSWKIEEKLWEATYITLFFFVLVSVFHLIFIAVDRVMIVLMPFRYDTIFTNKRQKIGIALIWVLGFAISISTYIYSTATACESITSRTQNDTKTQHNASTPIFLKKNESLCSKQHMKRIVINDAELVLSISIVVSDLLMILCYSTIIYQMSYKSRKCKTTKSKKDEGLPLLCLFITGVFVIFTLPPAITRFYLGRVPLWTYICLILNSGMNCVVYFFVTDLKVFKARILRRWKHIYHS